MPTFKDSAQLQQILGGFFSRLTEEPAIRDALLAAHLIVRFNYTDPPLSLTIDAGAAPITITAADAAKKPEVEMSMKADTAHRFWLGQVNLLMAITRGEMKVKGPIPKLLKLLPVIKPAYRLYPQYLREKGLVA